MDLGLFNLCYETASAFSVFKHSATLVVYFAFGINFNEEENV